MLKLERKRGVICKKQRVGGMWDGEVRLLSLIP